MNALSLFRKSLTALLLAAFMTISVGVSPALAVAPSNDDFNTPRVIGTLPYSDAMDVVEATTAGDDPAMSGCGLDTGLHSVWYSFTPASNGELSLDTFGSDYDTAVTIWTGTRGSLSSVICNDDSTKASIGGRTNYQGVNTEIAALLLAGTTYYIEVAQFSAYGGSLAATDLPAKPEGVSAQGTSLKLNASFVSMTALGLGKFDNANANIRYGGNVAWLQYSGAGPYAGTLAYTDTMGQTVSFLITGQRFKINYTQASNRGRTTVYVDNRYYGQFDAYGAATVWQSVWVSPVLLSSGTHGVKLVTTTGPYDDFDAVEVVVPTDTVSPGTISDLSATGGVAIGSINLTWTAPGDDGASGTIVSPGKYNLRYSSSPITNQLEWDQATALYSGIPAPLAPGSSQSMTISSLEPGQTYYFSVRAQDEENLAALSNVASAVATTPPPVGTGIWDDANTNWKYAGSWITFSGSGPYSNTLHYSGTAGSSATIFISGQKFLLYYTQATNRGIMDVYVDGIYNASINMNGALQYQKTWSSPTLSPGTHGIRFVHASGTYADVDAIHVKASVDLTPPAGITTLVAATGASNGQVNLSWSAVGDDGFTDTATSYLVRYSTSPITDTTTWNAATPVTTGVPTPGAPGAAESMTINGLTPGQLYYFAVRAQDEEPNLGALSNAASANAKGPDPLGAGKWDDGHANWIYTGSWASYSGAGPYLNTMHYTNVAGTQASVTITGQQFQITYTQSYNRGKIDVYVDNVLAGTINAYGSTTVWQKTWLSPLLASAGTHSVKLVYSSLNTAGTYIDVDAITVLGAPDSVFPAQITDLVAATGSSNGTVNLSWTASGDDGTTGLATSYVVCYAISAITDCNGAGVTKVASGIPTPAAYPTLQAMIVTGLTFNQTYYFAIQAVDDAANVGPISNSPSAVAKGPDPLGSGTWDDVHANWSYTGSWLYYAGGGPFSSTLHYTNVAGTEASVAILGQQFQIWYTAAANRGKIDVYVDGAKIGTINANNASTLWQQKWPSPTLASYGTHAVRLVYSPLNAAGTYIDVDAITVIGIPDTTPPGQITNLAAVAGTSNGQINLSWTATGDDNGTGTATSYQVRRAAVAIDGTNWASATPITTGVPVPQVAGTSQSMTVSGLNPGQVYYFAIRAVDEADALGAVSNSPSAPAKAPSPVGAGFTDDNHANWIWQGSWVAAGAGPAYNGTFHYSTAINDAASITFTGQKVTLYYVVSYNRGVIDVYIDGGKVASINAYGPSTLWQQTWSSSPLSAGDHTLRLVHASGTIIDVDAIKVFTSVDSVLPSAIGDLAAVAGASEGQVTLNWTAPGDDGTTGTATSYLVRYSKTGAITDEAKWSAATPVTTGVPAPLVYGSSQSMTVSNLIPGDVYYFAVRAMDEAENLGGLSNSPIGPVKTGTPVASGATYNDTVANWRYLATPNTWPPTGSASGGWTLYGPSSTYAAYYGSSVAIASTTGNSALITFNGTGFRFIYTQHTNRGSMDVYVDGVKVGTVNMNGATTYQKTWDYTGLASGDHVVKFVFISAAGYFGEIDGITIYP